MSVVLVLALVAVGIVLVFDYTNGFHDAANVVATVIASNAMTPRQAVVVVSLFEMLGPLLGGTAVANTIGGIVHLSDLDADRSLVIVLCALFGAIAWNLATWWRGLPSSSSHALVGALAGAVIAATDVGHVVWGFDALAHGELKGVAKVMLALVISPVIGFWVTFGWHRFLRRQLFRATPSVNGWHRSQT